MKEKHIAYKISHQSNDLVSTHHEFEEDKMLDLLIDIQQSHSDGIYWIFKEKNGHSQEALSIIDCEKQRIYFHYSGDVSPLDEVIQKLKGAN
tara:strand:+ start:454 stop:729 length:276 start_codon:yes stop_codon:yes gene_type:complete